MTKKIILTNDYHQTEITLRTQVARDGDLWLSANQVRRARRTLCGIADCTCGDCTGSRPRVATEYPDGTASVPATLAD